MLTAQDAFKVGFLARCVEDGLDESQIVASVKRASDMMEKYASGGGGGILGSLPVVGGLLGGAANAVGSMAPYAATAAIAAPPLLGGAAGYALAKGTDIDDRDVEDVKNREVIDEYARQTEKLRRLKQVKDYMKSKQTTGRIFM